MTEIGIGEHKGKLPGAVVINHPDYVQSLLAKHNVTGSQADLKADFQRLINIFDNTPYTKMCASPGCRNLAVKCTAYRYAFNYLQWWCDSCDPYGSGAPLGTLRQITSYRDALRYIDQENNRSVSAKRTLVRMLAQAKGLPKSVTRKAVAKFFGQ